MSGKTETDGQAPAPSPYVARDPEAFARNFAKALEEGGRALAAYLKPREEGQVADAVADTTAEVLKTLGKIGEYWTADPTRLMEAQTRLFGNYLAVWQNALAKAAGDGQATSVAPKPGDKRFSDPEWSENPLFSALKQLYLATTRWAEELVE